MITDYTVTDHYNQDCYNNYYRKPRNWDEYYDSLAEKADREYEDNLEEEN